MRLILVALLFAISYAQTERLPRRVLATDSSEYTSMFGGAKKSSLAQEIKTAQDEKEPANAENAEPKSNAKKKAEQKTTDKLPQDTKAEDKPEEKKKVEQKKTDKPAEADATADKPAKADVQPPATKSKQAAAKLAAAGKDAKGVDDATKAKVKGATEVLQKADEDKKAAQKNLKEMQGKLATLNQQKDEINTKIASLNKKIAAETGEVDTATDKDRKAQADADTAAAQVEKDKEKSAEDTQKADLTTIAEANERIDKLEADLVSEKEENEKKTKKLNDISDIAARADLAKSMDLETNVAVKKLPKLDFDAEKSLADLNRFGELEPIAASTSQGKSNMWFYGLIMTNMVSVVLAFKYYSENIKMRSFQYDLLEEF